MKSYQDLIKDKLLFAINTAKNYECSYFTDRGLIGTVSSEMGQYCETYKYKYKNQTTIKLFWDKLCKSNVDIFLKKLIFTEEALNQINILKSLNSSSRDYKNILQLEHISPKKYMYSKFLNLITIGSATKEDLDNIFKYSKLVVETKAECQKYFDGASTNNSTIFTDKDKELFITLSNDFPELKQYLKELDSYKCCRSSGNAVIRIIHLLNNGIKLVDYAGKELTFKEILNYLNDETFSID